MRVYNLITILSVVLATQTLGLEGRKRHHRHHHKTKHSPHHKRRLEKSKGLVPLSRDKIEWGNLGQKFTENQLTYKANKVAKVYKNPFLRNEVIHKKGRTAWKRSEGEYGKGEHKGSVGLERKVPQRGSKKEKIHHKSRSKKYELGYPTMQTSQSQSQGYGLGYAGNPMAQLMSQQVTAYQPMGSPGVSAYASSNGGQGADEQGVLQELAAQQKSTTDLGGQQDYQGSQSAEQSSPFQGDQTASYQGSEDQSSYQGSEAGSQTADQGRDSGEQTTAYQGVQTGEQTAAYQGNEAGDQTTAYQGGLAGDQTAAYQGAEGGDQSDSYQGQTSQGFGQASDLSRYQSEDTASQPQQGDGQVGVLQQGEQGVGLRLPGGDEGGVQTGDAQTGQEQGGMVEQGVGNQGGEEQQNPDVQTAVMQGNDQSTAMLQGEQTNSVQQDQTSSYQQLGDQGGMGGGATNGAPSGIDGGSIANLLGGGGGQDGHDADTTKLISDSQGITSSDAAQLASAIANANKGLTTNDESQASLSKLASSSSLSSLSYTGGQSNEGSFSMDSQRHAAEMIGDNNQGGYETSPGIPSYNSQNGLNMDDTTQLNDAEDQSPLGYLGDMTHHHHRHHYNIGGIGTWGEDSDDVHHVTHIGRLPHLRLSEARYCAGCPRHASCVDKVCIINDDAPLAKILAALSGTENETDDCNGCHHNAKCIKKECICKAGFSGDGTTCRVDNCVNGCSKHGKCIRGFCICDHSHYFNGAECAPYKISHRPCPEACAKRCTDDCPDKCCKVQDATKPSKEENSSKPTNKGGSSNKEVSTFFLKPTGHANHDASTSPEHHGKQDEPISHQGNHTVVPPQQAHSTEDSKPSQDVKPSPDSKPATKPSTDSKTPSAAVASNSDSKACPVECMTGQCGKSCPAHCCLGPGKSMSSKQLEILKTFARKFCPESCRTKCTNSCPPICCDSRSLISLLQSAAGGSEVDVTKTEDLFRNAMSWFGMMNFLNMMYNMNPAARAQYASSIGAHVHNDALTNTPVQTPGTPVQYASGPAEHRTAEYETNNVTSAAHAQTADSHDQNAGAPETHHSGEHAKSSDTTAKPTVKSSETVPHAVTTKPTVGRSTTPCPAACRVECTPSCELHCCAPAHDTYQRIYPQVHARSRMVSCPAKCASQCDKSCPSECCSRAKGALCSEDCEIHCTPACVRAECCGNKSAKSHEDSTKASETSSKGKLVSSKLHEVTATGKSSKPEIKASTKRECPNGCPTSCYPSCNKGCCSGSEKSFKQQETSKYGEYVVSIRCPVECRPYNCLSYCHHECCLRDNTPFIHLKSKISSSSGSKETAAPNTESARKADAIARYNDFHLKG
ncbi:uncharacterized protein LOC116613828 [Nematostella vectensis]|uniref:uncharacterized protein LOC116613828 n=1 Tax=Nematostella vectensis TaxID=45351 RepID=UPI0020774E17|nr:uncharacterized protein LOC116613828 [Nematostella vectensis]